MSTHETARQTAQPALEKSAADMALITGFLDMKAAERGASPNTLAAYARDLEHAASTLARNGTRLVDVSAQHIHAYLESLSVEGLAASSRARRLSTIRQFYRFLVAEEVVELDPTHGISGPRKKRALPKTLSYDEVDRLLNTAKNECARHSGEERLRRLRLWCLLEVLYATGLRVSELVSLPADVLRTDQRVLTIKGKGGRERLVPLNAAARNAMTTYIGELRRVREREAIEAASQATESEETTQTSENN